VTARSPERSIANLVHALAEAVDDADGDRIEAIFGDATFHSTAEARRVGGECAELGRARGSPNHDNKHRTLHQVSNLAIEVDPSGETASGRARITVLQQVPAVGDRPAFPLQPVLVGRYEDRYRRAADGSWRFVSRVMHVDLLGDTTFHSGNRL
jgi:hypothetical protein